MVTDKVKGNEKHLFISNPDRYIFIKNIDEKMRNITKLKLSWDNFSEKFSLSYIQLLLSVLDRMSARWSLLMLYTTGCKQNKTTKTQRGPACLVGLRQRAHPQRGPSICGMKLLLSPPLQSSGSQSPCQGLLGHPTLKSLLFSLFVILLYFV